MSMIENPWGVLLEGHQFDLQDWEEELPLPFDPHVAKVPDGNVPGDEACALRSTEFDNCSNAGEVREVAIDVVRTLSGLIAVRRSSRPVKLGDTIYEFRRDGRVARHVFAEIQGAEIRLRAGAVVVTDSGEPDNLGPKPSPTQSLARSVSGDLREALSFYSRADNWFDLYKALEAVEHHVGRRDDLKKLGFTREELSSLGARPQHFRHYKSDAKPPRELSFDEAKELMRRILDAVLRNTSP